MTQHIGIVACSAEGAALCYRTICTEGKSLLSPYAHPEISLHGHSLAEYVRCLEAGDLDGVARLMLVSADRLARAGADFLICPDNTIHAAFDRVEPRSPRPWLHIADVLADTAAARRFHRTGLLGTRWLVDSQVYSARLAQRGIECVSPAGDDRDAVDRIVMHELIHGEQRPASVERCKQAISRLAAAGCDTVILGCTELPLILDDTNSPLPTLDSTRLLARAALRQAVEDTPTLP